MLLTLVRQALYGCSQLLNSDRAVCVLGRERALNAITPATDLFRCKYYLISIFCLFVFGCKIRS